MLILAFVLIVPCVWQMSEAGWQFILDSPKQGWDAASLRLSCYIIFLGVIAAVVAGVCW